MALSIHVAIEVLAERFTSYDKASKPLKAAISSEPIARWPGEPDETVMVLVLKDVQAREHFQRRGFFFFNFAYKGDYQALHVQSNRLAIVHEGECYVGQTRTGYELQPTSRHPFIIADILIKREAFVHEFLPTLANDDQMLRRFLASDTDRLFDEAMRVWPAGRFRRR